MKPNKNGKMLKVLQTALLTLMCVLPWALTAQNEPNETAKKYPEIKFDKSTYDFGVFSQDQTLHTCVFKFTNTGKAKLVINYVSVSCGCTNVEYPKDYISPGGGGEIRVTYDSKGKMLGKFRKAIMVYTNCKDDLYKLYITGDMQDVHEADLKKK